MLADNGRQRSDDILFTEVIAPLWRLCQFAKEVRRGSPVICPETLAFFNVTSKLDIPVVFNGVARKGPQGLRDPRFDFDHI
jgi:hypothetical protein